MGDALYLWGMLYIYGDALYLRGCSIYMGDALYIWGCSIYMGDVQYLRGCSIFMGAALYLFYFLLGGRGGGVLLYFLSLFFYIFLRGQREIFCFIGGEGRNVWGERGEMFGEREGKCLGKYLYLLWMA